MSQEVERKFLTTNYHLAVVRTDEAYPDYSQKRWLKAIGAKTINVAHLAQYYLSLKLEEGRVVEEDRVRKKISLDELGQPTKIKFTRNSKFGSGLAREETQEEEIDQAEFEHLVTSSRFVTMVTGKPPQIHKIRTSAELGARTLEIDRYLGPDLGGLCVTEIEFPNEAEALVFKPEEMPRGILAQELDPLVFGNAQLALRAQIPEELILPSYLKASQTHLE